MTIPTATTSLPTPTAVRVKILLLQVMIIGSFLISGAHGWLVTSSSSLLSSSFSPAWQVHAVTTTTPTRCSTSRSLTTSKMTAETGTEEETEEPPFATIIGNGRIGTALAQAGNCLVLGRQDHIDPQGHGPILIATRNDSLDAIIDGCPANRRQDLVFLQNGYLESYLKAKGLLVDDNDKTTTPTQVLLYLSVAALGLPPTDGITTYNPEGLTLAYGRHADNFARRLSALHLTCTVCTDYTKEYTPAMYEKLMWISTYMLVGAAHGCGSVGEAQKNHQAQIETIITELVTAVSDKENIIFPKGTIARLASYTEVVAEFPCGVKEFEWRNQYFWNLGDDLVPLHNQLLQDCATKGLLSFALPTSPSSSTK